MRVEISKNEKRRILDRSPERSIRRARNLLNEISHAQPVLERLERAQNTTMSAIHIYTSAQEMGRTDDAHVFKSIVHKSSRSIIRIARQLPRENNS